MPYFIDEFDEDVIPEWELCGCDAYYHLHRQYSGECFGHDSTACPCGEYEPTSDHGPGGYEHGWRCQFQGFRRRPELDTRETAAWDDLLEDEIIHRPHGWDPQELIWRRASRYGRLINRRSAR